MARNINIELPSTIFICNMDGEAINWDVDKTPDAVIRDILVRGGLTVLTNVKNGGGKDASEAEKKAALLKKLDGWYAGEFSRVERGESQFTAMREAYVTSLVKAGMSAKAVDAGIRDHIANVLGADTKATFANFIEATAVQMERAKKGTREEVRIALESKFAAMADELAAERAKAGSKVKLPDIDLGDFLKAK